MAADARTIQLRERRKPKPRRSIVASVARDILAEIENGDLPKGEVGVVVAIIRDVLEAVRESKKGRSAAAIEGMVRRIVARVFDENDPVRKNIDDILWALKTAAAIDKKLFGGAVFEFAENTSVDAIMAAMQKVQRTVNSATTKLSRSVINTEFGKEMAALNLHGHVLDEAHQLIDAGLVGEMVSLMKDDSDLSKEMTDKLKSAGIRLAIQAGTAVATRCAEGKCNWRAVFCCCTSTPPHKST